MTNPVNVRGQRTSRCTGAPNDAEMSALTDRTAAEPLFV